MITLLRIWAVVGALSLITGEAYRSWGVGRPVAFWMDDVLAGALLLVGAWAMRDPKPRACALFAGGWGVATGMLYGSFFGKVFDPAHANPGNFRLDVLVTLIGVAFFSALACFILSIKIAGDAR